MSLRLAADSYERAEFLEPGTCQDRLAFVYYKQGECLFDGGQFLEALEVFKRAAALRPGNTAFKAQSLNCLLSAGRYDDSLETLDDLIAESPTADLYLARARLHHLMNQPVLCHQDLDSARALEPAHPEAAALLRQLRVDAQDKRGMAVEAALRGELRLAVTALNVAVDWDPQDGRLYLFRGTLLRRLRDFPAALEDLDRAAQLLNQDPGPAGAGSDLEELHQQTALTYNDMAVLSFTEERYTEAMQLLNRALDQDRNQPSVYLHRGDCFFRLGDWCFALADYQQAEEIVGSGDPAVRNRLAVIHNMLGTFSFEDRCFQEAVDMFSQALRYNPSASRYYENRLKARRKIQDVNGAREDLICLLVLDPSGDEVPAYLMSLFPRTKKSSIFSSPRGQAVQARLSEDIQTWIQSEDRRRLTERIQVTEAMSRLELADRQGPEQVLNLGTTLTGNSGSADSNKITSACPPPSTSTCPRPPPPVPLFL
ncbi:tetratricopeptide repeat protein 16-like [Cololabis saira]|uniref:tetratricopeptide repeat protein 16-like n=1 Tax=Cololabis saira TaxID=129043 RepID=UPI002AD1FA7A|nr:tetratricopeptide repeat protein 16-like [Cololabis saira]